MIELKRLEISGIRSFKENPDDINKQSIDFEGPVTLITGKNGTGKTTIIESLKYATVGNFPEEMVGDLNIWDRNEINSKVSLLIKSADNTTYNLIYNPSLSKSQATIKESSFTQGNCTLITTEPNGKQNTELIKESKLQDIFGASKAIIENVIFCSQNDSYWPIDLSPTKLKNKFDQIFGIANYNFFIQIAKKKIDEIDENIKKYKDESKNYEKYKDDYLKSTEKLENNQNEIEKFDSKINSIQFDLKSVNEQLTRYEKIQSDANKINNEILKLSGEFTSEENNLNLIKKKIKKIPQNSNLEEITASIKSLEKDYENKNNLLNERTKEQKLIEDKIKQIKNQNKKIENFKLEQKFLSQKVQQFKDLYDNENFDETLKQKKFILEKADEDLNKIDDDFINSKSDEIRSIEIDLSNQKFQMKTLNENLKNLESQSSNIIDINEEKIKSNQIKIKEAQKKLDDLIDLHKNPEILKQKIEEKKSDKKILISNKNDLLIMREKCNKNNEFINQIKNVDNKIETSKNQIELNLKLIKNALNDQSIDKKEAKTKFNENISSLKNKIISLNEKYSEINEKYIYTKIELENAKSDFERKQNEALKAKNKIDKVLSIFNKDYKEALEYVEDLLNKKNKKLSNLNIKEKVYIKFKKSAEICNSNNHHSCPLCNREFSSESEFHQLLLDHLNELIDSFSNKINEVQADKEKCENDLQKLREIENDVIINDDFQSKKESMLNNISKLQENENNFAIELKNINKNIKLNEEILEKLYKISFNVESLDKEMENEQKLLNEKKEISSNINQDLPSLEEVQNEIDQSYEKIENLSIEIMNLYDDQNHFSIEKNSLENSIETLNKENELMKNYLDNKKKLQSTNQKIQNLKEKLEELKIECEELKTQFNQDKEKKIKIKNEAQLELNKCNAIIIEIKKSQEKLQKFELNENYSNFELDLETSESQYKQITNEINSLNRSISQLKDEILESKLINDYININLKCNNIKSKLTNLENEKTEKLGLFETVNIKELTEKQKILNNDLIKNITNKENAEKIKNEEEKKISEFKPYLKKFNETLIRLAVNEKSKEDLERYIKRLDKEIVNYHSQKMAEINHNIHYLWQKTYHSQDIDSIYIRCEKELKMKNVNYNYYVIMKKNNAEMIMKNHCSAGQKMLASLIIRLAIAQTFQSKCSVIALDEPTTNIDDLNKDNLAAELINLINSNDEKRKFHLIIITHNRDFVQSFIEDGKISYFYQITRDANDSHNCSQIKKCYETNLLIGH